MKKEEIIAKLTERNVPFDETASKADLQDLLDRSVESVDESVRPSGIKVLSPEAFRPKVLPLIITLPEGSSKAQIQRAKVLNGFAYQFPDKWEQRKEELLKQLEALKSAPDPIEDDNRRLFVGSRPPTNIT